MIAARGLAFHHPDLDPGRSGLAVSASGALALAEDAALVRQALLVLLTTRPGERVMRPDYGCDIAKLVFWPNDATTAGLAIHYVRRAIERFEPRVRIVDIDAGPAPGETQRLHVHLVYDIKRTGWRDELGIAVDLTGER